MKILQKQIFQNGEEESMSLQEDSLANRFPWQESGKERMMTAISGRKCFALYGKFSPLGLLVKTLLESSRWYSPAVNLKWEAIPLSLTKITYIERNSNSSLKPSAKTLNEKVIPSNRLLFRLVPSARRTAETESSLLPTVQTQGLKRCNAEGKTEFLPLGMLPTPTSIDSGSGRINKSPSPNAKERPTIALAAKMGLLPSPVASDATMGAIIGKEDTFVMSGSGTLRKVNRNGTDGSVGLARTMSLLITPSASDAIRSTMTMDALRKGKENGNLPQQIAHKTVGGTSQLNPLFVEEMMGFPSMWSVLPFLSQNGEPEQSKGTEMP